jgi:preprotein translocase subunit Sec63
MLNTAYHILGLEKDVTVTQVKRRYRDLAVKFHPDKNPENYLAEEKFKLLQRSFSMVMLDVQKKANNLASSQRASKKLSDKNLPIVCRRKRRLCRSNRKFDWQLKDEFIGTNVRATV